MQIIEKNIDALKEYENNPRNNAAAVDKVAESIREFGFNVPIIIDKDNVIVAGHTRKKAAKKLGIQKVPCVLVDHLTPEQVKAFRLADNRVAEYATWDFQKLDLELQGLDTMPMEMFGFGTGSDTTGEERESERMEDIQSEQEELDRIFEERMRAGEDMEEDEEYQKFIEKFNGGQKKTTDDCYTPENVYEAVKNWCVKKYGLAGKKIMRPFYPGGDYQKEDYSGNCVVIDNPPFSILSEICEWYTERNIPYFMFCQSLTAFSAMQGRANYIISGVTITYKNGAKVNTSFITNLGDVKISNAPDLYAALKKENDINSQTKTGFMPTYIYPPEVLTATMLHALGHRGIKFELQEKEVQFVRGLDAQKEEGKAIYGAGFLISRAAAVEKEKLQKKAESTPLIGNENEKSVYEWKLSDREKEIIERLS